MKFWSLYSGSSGNSLFVSSKNTNILIDAGLTGKSIISAMESVGENMGEIDGIFVTHEHIDHVKGVGILSRKFDIPIFANEKTWIAMEKCVGKIKEENIKIIDGEVTLKDLNIKGFNVPHDSAKCYGYTVEDSLGKKLSTVTDMGVFTREIKENISDSEVILIESNHDVEMLKFGPYPYELKRRVFSELGHLSNADCARAIIDIMDNRQRKIILGHLSGTNNVPELAYKTVESILLENGLTIGQDKEIDLKLASRVRPSGFCTIE